MSEGPALTGIAAAVRDVLAAIALGQIWVTRDSDPVTGATEDTVDVWSSRPVRHAVTLCAPSATWVTSDFDISGRVANIPLAAARAMFPVLPDNDRECIVIG